MGARYITPLISPATEGGAHSSAVRATPRRGVQLVGRITMAKGQITKETRNKPKLTSKQKAEKKKAKREKMGSR
jgi:hypothetical protein